MKLHVFFSVHEQLFGPITQVLRRDHGLGQVSGFVWGNDQRHYLEQAGIDVAPLTVFTRDILDTLDDAPADLAYLAEWERRCGVSLQHMIFAERHLVHRYPYDRILRLAELIFRRTDADFEAAQPDVYFSEDVACLASYIHWAVAKHRGVKIVFLNNSRFPYRVTTYANPYQQYDLLDAIFPDTPPGLLTDADYEDADAYIRGSRDKPTHPPGFMFRAKLKAGSAFDLGRLQLVAEKWLRDPSNPTLQSPATALYSRGRRLVRNAIAEARGLYEAPVPGENYVLFPLHFQPEATTLVLAPYYLNQLAMIEDIAKSLPAGYRLYVKEHVISRGRWPLDFYEGIRRVPSVRLLSPDAHGPTLLRNAAAIAVITGTMGWEALLLGKPSITFGRVFYNSFPLVYRCGEVPKDGWPAVFRRAIFEHSHDEQLLRRFIACALRATFPGITGNPTSLPEILDPENVARLVRVVGSQIGLTPPLQGGMRAA